MVVQVIQHQEYGLTDASLPRILRTQETTDLHVNLMVVHEGQATAFTMRSQRS